MRKGSILTILVGLALLTPMAWCGAKKMHVVGLGAARRVHYSKAGDPAGARADEKDLLMRPLVVDGVVKEWTTGEMHDVTDRSFAVRRALKINDTLPVGRGAREEWVWQRGPWVLVDRVNGHVTALKLPEFDPGVSQAVWFRDYAAYCGLAATGKTLYAVVAQVAAHKPVLRKKIGNFDPAGAAGPACEKTEWQREPLKVTFHPAGHDAISYAMAPGSALLIEDGGDEDETPKGK
jgi:hypothetical protein